MEMCVSERGAEKRGEKREEEKKDWQEDFFPLNQVSRAGARNIHIQNLAYLWLPQKIESETICST